MTCIALLTATVASLLVVGVLGAVQIYAELVFQNYGASATEDEGATHRPGSPAALDSPNSSAQNSPPA
jgi:hypothetical protein